MKSALVWCSLAVMGLGVVAGCSGKLEAPPASAPNDLAQQPVAGVMPREMDEAAPAATAGPQAEMSMSSRGRDHAPAAEPQSRPGLGTTWGETRQSVISTSPFLRADSSSPFATAALFYNDEQGAKAMASATGFKRFSHGSVDIGGGIATVSLKDESGQFLSGFEASGKKFLVGESGERYTIVVQSHVPSRLEIVVSVDGLDVMDGKTASFQKRGYLIDPNGTIEIDGFRQSMETVAAFRFGSVRDSYSNQKTGETRNVGVIGIAAFNERGTNPSTWSVGDTKTRLQADPFPGRFATPPGG